MGTQTPEQLAVMQERMAADGLSVEENVQQDYFGFAETHRVTLPDGVSWVEYEVMNEGKRRKYLNEQNKGITVNRATKEAKIEAAPGDERWSLLRNTIVGWNLTRNGNPVPFSLGNLDKFLDGANPKVIDVIERDIRLKHPWLGEEMTVEDIDREIAFLHELREQAVVRESGNDN